MKLLTWNLAGRAGQAAEQIRFLGSRRADVVALQEVTLRTRELLRPRLRKIGLSHQLDTFELYPAHSARRGPRRYGILLASRRPFEVLQADDPLEWPERLLSVVLGTSGGPIEIHTTHVPPGSSNGWIKIDNLRGIFRLLAAPSERPRILCGDFNTPREKRPTGEVITWGQRVTKRGRVVLRKKIRGRDGKPWDAGERDVLVGLRSHNLSDVFRTLYGYKHEEYSWILTRKGLTVARRRFDHVFAAAELRPSSFVYLHAPREDELSDHSPAEVTFDWPD